MTSPIAGWCVGWASWWLLSLGQAAAIELTPDAQLVRKALQRGQQAAEQRIPPDQLYFAFGSQEDLKPRGFLMTRVGSLVVLANHMALRALTPSEQEIAQVLENKNLLVNVVIFGERPNFAVNSYVVLEQNGRTVKPENVRFDARAERSAVWPQQPAYRAKVVALFAYADLDPRAKTKLVVFPSGGGEVTFDLDFAEIE
ncbi:MAG TPA: hypothetical protein VHF07_06945 [Nitrospiraceae bacterium]|nr:hypothetical protein [Nitrospiraceae bacterium]